MKPFAVIVVLLAIAWWAIVTAPANSEPPPTPSEVYRSAMAPTPAPSGHADENR